MLPRGDLLMGLKYRLVQICARHKVNGFFNVSIKSERHIKVTFFYFFRAWNV